MMTVAPTLERLANICRHHGESKLGELDTLLPALGSDLEEVERALASLDAELAGARASASAHDLGRTPVYGAMRHLLLTKGKRLRPLCVLLAARTVGSAPAAACRDLAVSVELVHAATLLHDDVVDLGDQRRGRATSRQIFGNAASIFAGDWLLVEALERVRRVGVSGTLERLLLVLKEMLDAEALQLERRGRTSHARDDHAAIVRGKTASLFRWAVFAGGSAAGGDREACMALEAYGEALGMAFQLVDDVLDVTGDPAVTGKVSMGDLAEGTITYPLVLAFERDATLAALAEEAIAKGDARALEAARERLPRVLAETRAVEDTRALAKEYTERAVASLEVLPKVAAREALEGIAWALTAREG